MTKHIFISCKLSGQPRNYDRWYEDMPVCSPANECVCERHLKENNHWVENIFPEVFVEVHDDDDEQAE